LNIEDKIVTNQSEILKAQREFYKELYTPKPSVESELFINDECIMKLNDVQSESCEGLITLDEVKNVLSQMANNKSPGSDGYTVEFYKFFINDLGVYLVRSLNDAFNSGKLSITQRQGVITCIPKANKSREYLKNWRPISLLNTDYKILSGVLARRIKPVLCEIINEDQKGFLKNRCISENCRLVYDIMFELERRNKPGLLLMVDFEKAFDSVSWLYLRKVLDKYNFGSDFKQWFDVLYNESCSTVINNGHFSQFFPLGCGCRQGDPLSPYLFLLAIEPLALKIKSDTSIQGIKLGPKEHKLGQYADDLFLLQNGSRKSVDKTFYVFKKFELASGLKVNVEKTHAIWLGSKIGSTDEGFEDLCLRWIDNFTLLGIHFNVDLKSMVEHNINLAVGKIENVFRLYQNTPLSLEGKITVVKSLALPKLIHVLQVLPLPGKKYTDQINRIFRNFIWKNGRARISSQQLSKGYEHGGLKLTDISTLDCAIKISWIKRLCISEGGFQSVFTTSISDLKDVIWSLDFVSFSNLSHDVKNPFWVEVMRSWLKYYKAENKKDDVLGYPLWNSYLTNKNLLVKKSEFINKGIIYVNDLLSPRGGIMSHKEFSERYNVTLNFLDYHSLIQSMPVMWRKEIRKKIRSPKIENKILQNVKSTDKICRFVYERLLEVSTVKHKKIEKWSNVLGTRLVEDSWKYAFVSLRNSVAGSALRSFQYLLLHRAIVTNDYLFKCKIKDTDRCYFCSQYTESLEHLFWDCIHIKHLWSDFATTLKPFVDITSMLVKRTAMLGCEEQNDSLLINHLFILVKRYIYVQKCKENTICLKGLMQFIKQQFILDTHMSNSKRMIKWQPLMHMLQNW